VVRRYTFSIVLSLLVQAGSCAAAEDVHLAVPLSMQPYFIPAEGKGLIFETVRAAFEAEGYGIAPMYVSQKAHGSILHRDSKVDCAALLSREESEGWSAAESVHSLQDYAITLSANRLKIERLADLKGKSIIAYGGALHFLGPELREVVQDNPRYREVNNHKAQVKLLLKNRVDVIIADKLLVQWYLGRLREESGTDIPITYHRIFEAPPLFFACRRRELIDGYLAGIDKIRRSGVLDSINASYLK
jgi:polar amino acid transport system substrate-binding protein